jgi:hypothetical protein
LLFTLKICLPAAIPRSKAMDSALSNRSMTCRTPGRTTNACAIQNRSIAIKSAGCLTKIDLDEQMVA